MIYAKDKEWLFSSSGASRIVKLFFTSDSLTVVGDSTIRIWSTISLRPLYIIDPYDDNGAGDLFSLAWDHSRQILYVGCQNTSLQWLSLATTAHDDNGTMTPSGSHRRAHKFFDSYPQYERKPADLLANNTGASSPNLEEHIPRRRIPSSNVIDAAHYGYIYCMAWTNESGPRLVTGAGDETLKVGSSFCSTMQPEVDRFQGLGLFFRSPNLAP